MKIKFIRAIFLITLCAPLTTSYAQGLTDAFYMPKKNLCAGVYYTHDQWKNYWEGTFKRENLNLGTVSNNSVQVMANYGITAKLNAVVGLPYVWTKASAGTLSGMSGIQDLTAGVKYNAFQTGLGKGQLSVHAVGGFSIPITNYAADFLPLSIGVQSKTLFGRAMLNYTLPNNLFLTVNGTYTGRSNITIDRPSYYTTELINSNEVAMPNLYSFQARAGYNIQRWGAVAIYEQMNSTFGFDIRRNDMPFPSNKMNAKRVGAWFSYRIKKADDIQVTLNVMRTLAGRNMGQSSTIALGVAHIFDFNKKIVPVKK